MEALRADHLERQLTEYAGVGGRIEVDGRTLLNFASNDYLNLSTHPAVVAGAAQALKTYGAGAAASRLVVGTLPVHTELEEKLARFKDYPSALVFGSGYMTNAGVISSVVGRGDTVYADRLVHASVLDAIVLSHAALKRFRHNDADHLASLLSKTPASGRRLIVTESVFSMDGDIAPLPAIAEAATRHDALLMVDEAHATGVFGRKAAGLVGELGLTGVVHLSMGTLSKALGSYGGFVACSKVLKQFLVNHARAFIYTTAPSPASVSAAVAALNVVQSRPEMGSELLSRAATFREQLQSAGLDTMESESQIVPVLIGSNEKALALAARLRQEGILTIAIRPPTVPTGTARLRLSLTLGHELADLALAAEHIIACAKAEHII